MFIEDTKLSEETSIEGTISRNSSTMGSESSVDNDKSRKLLGISLKHDKNRMKTKNEVKDGNQ